LCIDACPVDAIVGTHKLMHTVVESECTGCELCIPVCPVDCIQLENATPHQTAWSAWSQEQAQRAKSRYGQKLSRLQQNKANPLPISNQDIKSSRLEAALARAKQQLESKPRD
jgi:Na+-translocating ferredoxin:NAD+ oxidoreductase subunit B